MGKIISKRQRNIKISLLFFCILLIFGCSSTKWIVTHKFTYINGSLVAKPTLAKIDNSEVRSLNISIDSSEINTKNKFDDNLYLWTNPNSGPIIAPLKIEKGQTKLILNIQIKNNNVVNSNFSGYDLGISASNGWISNRLLRDNLNRIGLTEGNQVHGRFVEYGQNGGLKAYYNGDVTNWTMEGTGLVFWVELSSVSRSVLPGKSIFCQIMLVIQENETSNKEHFVTLSYPGTEPLKINY